MENLATHSFVDPEIPNKLYFRIGEVAKLAAIKPYVLRFWESERNRARVIVCIGAKTSN